MAAFTGTPTSSLQYADQLTSQMSDPVIGQGQLRCHPFKYTHTATEGAGTGEVNLTKLPAGLIRVLPNLSHIHTYTAFGSSADLHIGYRAHTNMDGTSVSEDDNAFADNLDAGGGALDAIWALPAVGYLDLDSQDGVVIFALIDSGNIEATDTIEGYCTFIQVG